MKKVEFIKDTVMHKKGDIIFMSNIDAWKFNKDGYIKILGDAPQFKHKKSEAQS